MIDIYLEYPTQRDCISLLESIIWNNNPVCPYCNSKKHTRIAREHRYHCNGCNTSYGVTVGTLFHKTKVDLRKWFYVIHLEINTEQKLSVRQLASIVEVTKDTASFLRKRIRQDLIEQSDIVRMLSTQFSQKNNRLINYNHEYKNS